MLPYTLSADIYAAPIRINCATRHRKYRVKDIGARYYDANERFRPLESAWNPPPLEIHDERRGVIPSPPTSFHPLSILLFSVF